MYDKSDFQSFIIFSIVLLANIANSFLFLLPSSDLLGWIFVIIFLLNELLYYILGKEADEKHDNIFRLIWILFLIIPFAFTYILLGLSSIETAFSFLFISNLLAFILYLVFMLRNRYYQSFLPLKLRLYLQRNNNNDLSQENLYGKVKSIMDTGNLQVRYKGFCINQIINNASHKTKITFFNRKGYRVSESIYNSHNISNEKFHHSLNEAKIFTSSAYDRITLGTLIEKTDFKYDNLNKLIEKCLTDSMGQTILNTKYTYDDSGKISEALSYDSGSKLIKKLSYQYNDNDSIKEQYFSADGTINQENKFQFNNSKIIEIICIKPGIEFWHLKYLSEDHKYEETFYEYDNVENISKSWYDANLYQFITNPSDVSHKIPALESWVRDYGHKEKNNYFDQYFEFSLKNIEYDNFGNILKFKTWIDYNLEYKIDNQLNWIYKKINIEHNHNIFLREIKYYPSRGLK